jgi:hypothetical protein
LRYQAENVSENGRRMVRVVMRTESKLVLFYTIVVAVLTLLYVEYEDLGFLKHATANPATAQVEADDE